MKATRTSNIIYNINKLILAQLSNIVIFFYKWIIGIKLHNCKFYGIPVFNFKKGSEVIIGEKCTFNSTHKSNLIGINHPCMISTFSSHSILTIGNGCGFSGTIIGVFKKISLGNNVRCGANTVITDGDWHLDDYRVGPPQEIIIKDNVWLGLNTIVLKGVTIGENSVIGAGSVVIKDIPINVIVAGNPCKVIRSI